MRVGYNAITGTDMTSWTEGQIFFRSDHYFVARFAITQGLTRTQLMR
jgi:hypothetical protein